MLASSQLAGNQQLIQTLLNQVEDGTRQKSFLSVDQTEYTSDNKKAMALLLMLIERKDYITQRLSELEVEREEEERNLIYNRESLNKEAPGDKNEDLIDLQVQKLIQQA